MPGPLKMMFLNVWDQGVKCISTCKNVVAIGRLANPVGVAAILVKQVTYLASTNSGVGNQKEDDMKALTTALKYASELYILNKYLQEKSAAQSSQESTEDASTKNRKDVQQVIETGKQTLEIDDIEWIHKRLETIVKELSEQQKCPSYVEFIAVCLRTKKLARSDDMQWKCLLNEIDSILKETETLKTLSDQFFFPWVCIVS